MELLLPLLIGAMFAAALFLLLHRHFFKLILGLMLFSTATNLFIFVIADFSRGSSAIIPQEADMAMEPFADPVPQALLLTAIVIGFGILAFSIVLVKRVYESVGTNDLDDLNQTDQMT